MSESVVNANTDGNRAEVDAVRLRSYPGQISRQELNDFCVELAEKSRVEMLRQQKILADDEGKNQLSDEQFESLYLSIASLSGGIGQLRAVTEFARKRYDETQRPFFSDNR